MRLKLLVLQAGLGLLAAGHVTAQQAHLSLKEALELVTNESPAIKSMRAQADAASRNPALAKTSLIPELTAGYQVGYATYNNVTGMAYPGLFLPISGPPTSSNSYDGVPGSVVGAMLKWEPLTFGQRQAAVDKAAAQYQLATNAYNDALFRREFAVITTYMDAAYLAALTSSYQANIDRTESGLEQALVLAREGLKAGIDTIQFQAVLAQAQMDMLTLQKRYSEQLNELSRLTGMHTLPQNLLLTDTLFMQTIPGAPAIRSSADEHPFVQLATSRLQVTRSSLKEVQKEWLPKFDIWANAYARGSGVGADGAIKKSDGWSPDHRNYGIGIQLSFPLLGFAKNNIRIQQYKSMVRADEAALNQTRLDVQTAVIKAQDDFRQDLRIVQQSQIQTNAARSAYDGLKISYSSGLSDYTRLMQGQLDLLRAEAAQAGATLQSWRAVLDMAISAGNLQLFTDTLQ